MGVTAALSAAGLGLGLFGGISQAGGEREAARAQAETYGFDSMVSRNNAARAEQNAGVTAQQGEIESTNESLKTGAEVAGMKVREAASGIDVNTGSALSAREAALRLGQINAMTIKSNRSREAWGYMVDASNDKLQADLYDKAGVNAIKTGKISSASTMLATAGTLIGGASKLWSAGGFNFGGSKINASSDTPNNDVTIGGLY